MKGWIQMNNNRLSADFVNTFECDLCSKIIQKEETVFTHTSYGGKAWLCRKCAIDSGISVKDIGIEKEE